MKFAILSLMLLLSLSLAQPMPGGNQKISLKVNLGGGPVGDFLGEEQVLDTSAFSKNVARVPIQNTDQPEVFQSQRFARSSDLTIRIPVPDGVYSLTLLFAETFRPACVPGKRVFDISLGTPVSGVTKVVEGFDVFQSAGCAAAHGKRFDNLPSKEGIVVHLSHRAQHPSLAGFIVEGFPVVKGDGSEYKAIARMEQGAEDGGMGFSGGLGDAAGAHGMPGPMAMPGDATQMGAGPDMGAAPPMARDFSGASSPPQAGIDASGGMGAPQQMGMEASGAIGAPPGLGSPMGSNLGSQAAQFAGRRRLLSVDRVEEKPVIRLQDVQADLRRSRGHSQGLKWMKADVGDKGVAAADLAIQIQHE